MKCRVVVLDFRHTLELTSGDVSFLILESSSSQASSSQEADDAYDDEEYSEGQ